MAFSAGTFPPPGFATRSTCRVAAQRMAVCMERITPGSRTDDEGFDAVEFAAPRDGVELAIPTAGEFKFTPRTTSPTWSTAPSAVLRCGRNQRRVLPPNLLHKRDAVGGQAKPRFVIDGRPAGTGTRHPARGEHPATATRSFVCGNGLFQSNVGNHRRTRRGKSPYPRFVVCEETRSPRRVTSQWLPPAKRRHSMPHSSRPHEAGVDRAIPSGGRWKTDPGTALLTAKFTSARLSAAGKSSGGVKVAASQEYLRY